MNKLGLGALALVAGLGCGESYFDAEVKRGKGEMLKTLDAEHEGVTKDSEGRFRAVYCDVGDMSNDGAFATRYDKTYIRISNVVRDVVRGVCAGQGNAAVAVFDEAVRSVIKNPSGNNVEVVCVAATAVTREDESVARSLGEDGIDLN